MQFFVLFFLAKPEHCDTSVTHSKHYRKLELSDLGQFAGCVAQVNAIALQDWPETLLDLDGQAGFDPAKCP